jgi:hypothetical protein
LASATLLTLRTEVKARGYDYVTDTRVNYFVNTAYAELCELYPWPWLETTSTLSVPGTLANARTVLSVNDSSTSATIHFIDRQALTRSGTILTTAGTPSYAYFEGDVLTTYPLASGQVTVRYARYASTLVADTDQVLVPERWSDVVVDGACVRAAKDAHNWDEVAALRQEYNAQVKNMHDSYFSRSGEPSYILVTQSHDEGC